MKNQVGYQPAHFSELAYEDKVWACVLFGRVPLVMAVLTALAVHACAQCGRDAEDVARASEVQLS